MIYFKPSAQNRSTIAKFINASNADKWSIALAVLRKGHFVAVGNFLVDGIPVDYPITIDSTVDTLEKNEMSPKEICKNAVEYNDLWTVNGDNIKL